MQAGTVNFSGWNGWGYIKSYGIIPASDPLYRAKWERAKQLGLVLSPTLRGDRNWLNDNPKNGVKILSAAVAPFTRYFKSTNEIDIRTRRSGKKLREPAALGATAPQWEYSRHTRAQR